ncbi:MAG: ABC transporter permease [Actinoplanes sp.]
MTAPANVDEQLVERARQLAARQGEVPSQNRLKTDLRVGVDKARLLRGVLLAEVNQRREGSRRQMKSVAAKARQNRPARVVVAGPRPVLPVPTSPGVGPLVPVEQDRPEIALVAPVAAPEPTSTAGSRVTLRKVVTWPALLVAAPAFVAIWAGWVAIGKLTGFGRVNLLPGFWSGWTVDTAITLPIGVEAYAAYAFYVALHSSAPARARKFAAWSAGLAVVLGMGGQAAYHLMSAAHMDKAPWQITTLVSCLPVAVFGVAAALVHMVRAGNDEKDA